MKRSTIFSENLLETMSLFFLFKNERMLLQEKCKFKRSYFPSIYYCSMESEHQERIWLKSSYSQYIEHNYNFKGIADLVIHIIIFWFNMILFIK